MTFQDLEVKHHFNSYFSPFLNKFDKGGVIIFIGRDLMWCFGSSLSRTCYLFNAEFVLRWTELGFFFMASSVRYF